MSCGLSFLGGSIAGDEANALEDCGAGRRNGALRRCEDTKRSWTVGRVDEKRKWAMSLFVSLSQAWLWLNFMSFEGLRS